jgi:hypothetical protein
MFADSNLNLMTKLCVGEPIVKSRGCPVFDFNRAGRGGWRFVNKSEMARASKAD